MAEALEAGARGWRRPSGLETREREAQRRRHDQGARLRARESARSRQAERYRLGAFAVADPYTARNPDRGNSRRLHEPGAKRRASASAGDIFAFGSVLYEMLTGKRAFAGEDVSEIMASVVTLAPDWNLPNQVPPS